MRQLITASAVGLALALAVLTSCGANLPELAWNPNDTDSGTTSPDAESDSDTLGDAPGTPPDAADAGLTPIVIGITPTPRSNREDEPTAGDVIAAELTTFAAGVRGVVVTRHLRDLDSDAYASLEQLERLYTRNQKQVLFNLALVDRVADGRPAPLAGLAWDDPAVLSAVQGSIDAVLGSFGATLAYFTVGRDVDVYLTEHADERAAFERLATQACTYALASPNAPPGLHVGIGLSSSAAMSSDPALTDALRTAGDVSVLSYFPGFPTDRAGSISDVAVALDAMIRHSQGRSIVLQAVGYPSSPDAGSSEEKQRLFFEAFFDALGPRRSAIAFVNVAELHDRSPAACRDEAMSQGAAPTGAFVSSVCSLGLFGQGEVSKPAWMEVLDGAATFASP